jgi:nicotinic acid mononucleotide adenylyltransferase
VHCGHVELASDAVLYLRRRSLDVNRVVLIPTGFTHRVRSHPLSSFEDRFEMCRLGASVIEGRLKDKGVDVIVSRIEWLMQMAHSRPEPSYLSETLSVLHEAQLIMGRDGVWRPCRQVLLFGSDVFSGPEPPFATWRHGDDIVAESVLAICDRQGWPVNDEFMRRLEESGGRIIRLGIAPKHVSARRVRERVASGERPDDLAAQGILPRSVAEYIVAKGLYRA